MSRPRPPGVRPCRACGVPIVWLSTDAGRKMPVEAFPDGTYPAPGQRYDWEVHTDHWRGCPAAERFKRRATPEKTVDPMPAEE